MKLISEFAARLGRPRKRLNMQVKTVILRWFDQEGGVKARWGEGHLQTKDGA